MNKYEIVGVVGEGINFIYYNNEVCVAQLLKLFLCLGEFSLSWQSDIFSLKFKMNILNVYTLLLYKTLTATDKQILLSLVYVCLGEYRLSKTSKKTSMYSL